MDLLIILGAFGTTEIVVLVILALLLFGGKKIPELMKGLATGLKEFKKASSSNDSSSDNSKDSTPSSNSLKK